MIEIRPYKNVNQVEWNELVRSSRQGTFLFERAYMDYHQDRFPDSSFLFYKKKRCVAVIAGTVLDTTYYSHKGLTYGGFLTLPELGVKDLFQLFSLLISTLKEAGICKVIYKSIPSIYSSYPAEEEQYVLFRNHARWIEGKVSSAMYLPRLLTFPPNRRTGSRKAQRSGLIVRKTTDFTSFWKILNAVLQEYHQVEPVHSLSEILTLYHAFPNQIQLYGVYKEEQLIAGTVLFITPQVVHSQYIASNEIGRRLRALDFLFDTLLHGAFFDADYFDFGISTEEGGWILNEGLLAQKESYSGRGIMYNSYQIDIE